MPTPDDLAGFILKKEACATFNRSFRQLGRDLDKAFARRDESFLDNFRLRLEDGTVLTATEVSKEQIQKLRDKGLNPTWFVREQWMQGKYGLRTGAASEQPVDLPKEPEPANGHESARSDSDPPIGNDSLIHSKDDLISFLRDENAFLRDTLSQERQRGSEDRQLTRELHILLKNMQDRLLPEPGRRSAVVAVDSPRESEAHSPKTVNATAQPTSQSRAKKQPTRKQPARRAAKKPAPKKKKAQSKTPKWYETPTLKRLFFS